MGGQRIQDAAYRGTLHALAALFFLLAALSLPLALFGLLSGSRWSLVTPLALAGLGWALRVVSRWNPTDGGYLPPEAPEAPEATRTPDAPS